MSRVLGLALLGLSFACAPGAASLEDETSGDADVGEGETEAPVCGNGIVEGDEACDDANDEARDGCESTCEASGRRLWTVELPAWVRGMDRFAASEAGVIVAGESSTLGGHCYLRIDAEGQVGDSIAFPRLPAAGEFGELALAQDGSVLYFRRLESQITGELEYSLRRMDVDGELSWATTVEAYRPGQLAVVQDEVIAVATQEPDPATGNADWWIRAFDLNSGAQSYQWTRPASGFQARSLSVAGSAGFVVGGVADEGGGLSVGFAHGQPQGLWSTEHERYGEFAAFADAGFVHGTTLNYGEGGHGSLDFYDADGELRGSVSTDLFDDTNEFIADLLVDRAGDVVVLNMIVSDADQSWARAWRLSKYDADGRFRWAHRHETDSTITDLRLGLGDEDRLYVFEVRDDPTGPVERAAVHAHAP